MSCHLYPYHPNSTSQADSRTLTNVNSSSLHSDHLIFAASTCRDRVDIDLPHHEEQISIQGKTAIWTSHSNDNIVTLSSFSPPSPILQSCLCRFPSLSSSSFSVCLLLSESIIVYDNNGEIFNVQLPCRASRCYALSEGLIVERWREQIIDAQQPMIDSTYPTLFSLFHPLEDIAPVSRVAVDDSRIPSMNEDVEADFMSDAAENLIFASEVDPFIVTYHHHYRHHRLYIIRHNRKQALKRRRRNDLSVEDTDLLYEDKNHGSIMSELLLHPCWEQTEMVDKADSIFLVSDIQAQPLLCFLHQEAHIMLAYRVLTSSISSSLKTLEYAFKLDAVSAVPIKALFNSSPIQNQSPTLKTSQDSKDILLLNSNQQLCIYSGSYLLAIVSFMSPILDVPFSFVSVSRSVNDRFSLLTGNGSWYRAVMEPAFHLDSIRACFHAISYMVNDELMLALRKEWLILKQLQSEEEDLTAEGDMISREWSLFGSFIHQLISAVSSHTETSIVSHPSPISPVSDTAASPLSYSAFSNSSVNRKSSRHTRFISTSPSPEATIEANDAWSSLLASSYHRHQISSQHSSIDGLTGSFHSPLTSSCGPAPSPTLPPNQKRQKKKSSNIIRITSSLRSDSTLTEGSIPRILLGLHLVYEDHKLNQLHHHVLPHLAAICHTLAICCHQGNWIEYYRRDQPQLLSLDNKSLGSSRTSNQSSIDSSILPSVPPSIYEWMRESFSSSTAVIYPIPSLAFLDRQSPLELTRKVCECVDLLIRITGDRRTDQPGLSSRYALQAVNQLNQQASGRMNHTVASKESRGRSKQQDQAINGDSYPVFMSASSLPHPCLNLDPSLSFSSSWSSFFHTFSKSFSLSSLSLLPEAVSLPFYEFLNSARSYPSELCIARNPLSPSASILVGRSELARMTAEDEYRTTRDQSNRLRQKMEMAAGRPDRSLIVKADDKTEIIADEDDGTLLTLSLASFRFGVDLRLKEVVHILRSNRIISLSLSADRITEIESSNGTLELATEQQQRLQILCRRVLALPLARGMFTLSSISPMLLETFPIPNFVLTARLQPKETTIDLDLSALPQDLLNWPCFHNGVAAGLRIQKGENTINRSWIIYNRPSSNLTFTHAGWLFALGLQGHLNSLAPTDLFWYLSQHHDPTTIAILLGMSAAKRATMDTIISKMLCLHIPAFLPIHLDMEIPLLVKTTAVVGIGLLYEGSAHRLMTEVLIAEVSKPANDHGPERAAYCLAAGMALGLVLLARGGEAVAVSDLHLEDRLIVLLQGGRYNNRVDNIDRDHQQLSNKSSNIDDTDLINIDQTAPAATTALALMYFQSNNQAMADHLLIPTSHYELDYVRADFLLLRTLARAMIMWDHVIATKEWIDKQIPTIFKENVCQMEEYYPWTTTTTLPQTSKSAEKRMQQGKKQTSPSNDSIHMADSDNENELNEDADSDSSYSDDGDEGDIDDIDDIDYEAIRQGYCHIIAGACLAIGMKYAGSADIAAQSLLTYYVRCFRSIRRHRRDDSGVAATVMVKGGIHSLTLVDRYTIETCLLVSMISLSLIMAGTGDLASLRLFRSLRLRMDEKQSVSQQQMLHMALGFIFLGGGRFSISTTKSSLSSLFISIFPVISSSSLTSDHRAYLQPLRHLYVLSTVCRSIRTIDVDSQEECYCQININQRDERQTQIKKLELLTPCLLPDINSIQSLSVIDNSYWPISVSFSSSVNPLTSSLSSLSFPASCTSPYVLYVKRRKGLMLYNENATSFRTLLHRLQEENDQDKQQASQQITITASKNTLSRMSVGEENLKAEMMKSLSSDPLIMTFYRLFAAPLNTNEPNRKEAALHDSYADLLYECVSGEKMSILTTYLKMHNLNQHQKTHLDVSSIKNLQIIFAYYQHYYPKFIQYIQKQLTPNNTNHQHNTNTSNTVDHIIQHEAVLSASFIASIQYELNSWIYQPSTAQLLLQSYLQETDLSSTSTFLSMTDFRQLSVLLTYADYPNIQPLMNGIKAMKEMMTALNLSIHNVNDAVSDSSDSFWLPLAAHLFPSLSAAALRLLIAVV